jgi:gas vesicle protein GvpL/GvpF
MTIAADAEPSVVHGGIYVYAVVRAGEARAPGVEGIGGSQVDLVPCGDLAALVTRLPERGWKVKRRDLERHLGVLESAFAGGTILPCPFGTVVESVDDLEDALLAGRRSELLDGLARLDGRVQMNVKALYDEEALLRSIVASDREIASLRERTRGTGDDGYYHRVRLGELIAARVEARREEDGRRLESALARAAVDVVAEPAGGEIAFRAAFLVARSSLRTFDAAVEAVAAAEQPLLRFEAIGPLPPTVFTASYVGM